TPVFDHCSSDVANRESRDVASRHNLVPSEPHPEEPMAYETILLDHEDGVGIVTLNRPESLNAMNRKLGAELADAMALLNTDDGIGCIVITGAGEKAVSAGGGVQEEG